MFKHCHSSEDKVMLHESLTDVKKKKKKKKKKKEKKKKKRNEKGGY